MATAAQHLTRRLGRLLSDARIVATPLPLTPGIRLFLLDQDYPRRPLPDEERRRVMEEPPYWAFCWSSGQVLARWILDLRADVRGRRVLDFGAGSGVAAIAAAAAGAREVIALDIDPLAREAILANAEENGVTVAVAESLDSVPGGFDRILAADVLYDPGNLPLLSVFRERSRRVVVADSRVRELPAPYALSGEGSAVSCPDLDEPEEFRHVRIFTAGF